MEVLAALVIQVLLAHLEELELLALLDSQAEMVPQGHLVLREPLVSLVVLEEMDHLETQVLLDVLALQDYQAVMVLLDPQEILDEMVS